MIVKVLILAGLIRLLLATGNPILCSGIYAGVALIFSLLFGKGILVALIGAAIGFALATLYFWLLNRYQDRTVAFWVIAGLGVLIGIV